VHRADVGLLPAEYAEAIAAACRADDFDPAAIGIAAASSGNPVAPLVRLLTTNVRRAHGEPAAGWVHHGATSQDVADTATMLLVRDAIQVIVADVAACADRCAELARKHEHTLLAGRTLLQQALPTTFGLKAAGWLHALDEAAAELRRVSSTLPAQLVARPAEWPRWATTGSPCWPPTPAGSTWPNRGCRGTPTGCRSCGSPAPADSPAPLPGRSPGTWCP